MVDRASMSSSVDLGALHLTNRIVMAPLTRSRALPDGTPGPAARLYYAQRASAGLIVSEGVCISPTAVGNPGVPGLWTERHVEAWAEITGAVHAAGGTMVAQLWHTGRASHPSVQPGEQQQVGPSAIAIDGLAFARDGLTPHVVPRALDVIEIGSIVRDYAAAAVRARRAGFDGVELHAANGYLIDQFLQDNANHRVDEYGGGVERRTRFLREVLTAVTGELEPDRVGVRLSPSSTFQDMADSRPDLLFAHVLADVERLAVAYLHVVEPGVSGAETADRAGAIIDSAWVRARYSGKIIAAGNYSGRSAADALRDGRVDAVAFGRAFIANPDLPQRLTSETALNVPDPTTFYTGGTRGYIDYPSLEAQRLHAAMVDDPSQEIDTLSADTAIDDWHRVWALERMRSGATPGTS